MTGRIPIDPRGPLHGPWGCVTSNRPSPASDHPAAARDRDGFGLPAKIAWLWALGPFLLAPIVIPSFLLLPLRTQIATVASFAVGFLGIGCALFLAYAKLWRPQLERRARMSTLLLIHALFVLCIVAPSTIVLQPAYCLVSYWFPSPSQVQYCLHHITPTQRLEFLWTSLVVSWGSILPAVMVHGLRRDRDAIEARLQEERRSRLGAQLQALQARLQPHFLFNSLNTIACLIQEDPAAAERVVERLAELLRYNLGDLDRPVVPLRDELAVVQAYLEVQAARFGARLRFAIDCPQELAQKPVPPLSLQPLVENAVLHGAVSQRRGGMVHVRAEAVSGQLAISVQDDGPGLGGSPHHGNGVALSGLRERLRILYPDAAPPASLELQPGPNRQGCLVVLRLPLRAGPEE